MSKTRLTGCIAHTIIWAVVAVTACLEGKYFEGVMALVIIGWCIAFNVMV